MCCTWGTHFRTISWRPLQNNREFKKWRQERLRRHHKSTIWLMEWRTIIVLHVRHPFWWKICWRSLPNDDVNFSHSRLWRQREHAAVNLSLGSLKTTTGTATTTPQIKDLIGWMKKNNRATRAARFLAQFFDRSLPNDNVKFPYLRFRRQPKPPAVNL